MKQIERHELLSDPEKSLMFPDVATDGQKIVCCYVESQNHWNRSGSRLCLMMAENIGDWEDGKFTTLYSKPALGSFYNSPRIICCGPNHFLVIVDVMPLTSIGPDFITEMGSTKFLTNYFIESVNGGKSWNEMSSDIVGICPSIFQTNSDFKRIATTTVYSPVSQTRKILISSNDQLEGDKYIFREDCEIESPENVSLSEATIVQTGDMLVLIARSNSSDGKSAYRSLSTDNGKTWSEPKPFFIPGGGHRPTIIPLLSGNYFCSFRFFPGCGFDQNTMIALIPPHTLTAPRSQQRAIIRPLDYNPNLVSDQGYTGACQLNDGSILVVNYMNPPGFIRTGIYYYRFGLDVFNDSFRNDKTERGNE